MLSLSPTSYVLPMHVARNSGDPGCAKWPRTSSILDRDALSMPWMRLCARYQHIREARAYPMHLILGSGSSEGAILHRGLSSPIAVTPTPASSSTAIASTPAASRHIRKHGGTLSARPANPTARATPSKCARQRDSNVWDLTFHPLGHLPVPTSSDHTTRFCAHKCPGGIASALAPDTAKPAASVLDNDADGEQDDEDDSLVIPVFGGSATTAGAASCDSAGVIGGGQGGVGSGTHDIVPGFGGGGGSDGASGGNEVPKFGG